jgi:hypothetical protein
MDYVLVDQDQRPGRNAVTMWRLTFYCVDDATLWEMTVDPTYDNFKRSGWDHVVRDENSYGVYADLKRTGRHTREGTPIVSADSPARITYRCQDRQEALRLVEANEHPPSTWQELFRG